MRAPRRFDAALGLSLVLAACSGQISQGEDPSLGEPGMTRPGATAPGEGSPGAPTAVPGSPATPGTPGTPSSPGLAPPSAALAASACNGASPVVAVAPLRRLTRREYGNTVRDLLGDPTNTGATFVVDARVGLFENNAGSAVTALGAFQYADAAEALARTAAGKLASIVPCAAASADDPCARELIRTFGKRAYRRPLTDAEQTRLFAAYGAARTSQGTDFGGGIRHILTAMLQSPNFINHVERGTGAPDRSGAVALTPYEKASRLSYLLWGSMPDAALFAAADANKLGTPAEIEAQATRMLADPRAKAGVLSFFRQWLSLEKVDELDRSTKMFPMWNTALRGSMRRETEAFIEHVFWQGDARLTTLLAAPFTFANAALGKLYETLPVNGDALVRTDLDASKRAGLLTQASLLTLSAHYDQTSPVHRGLQVRERFLCLETPSPPSDVDVSIPMPNPKLTTRQRFEQHRADAYCAGCHRLLDPIGMGFESYDAVGRFRATENGLPIDPSGEIVGSRGADGAFSGAVDLAGRLARTVDARACMATLWLSYGTGGSQQDAACAAARLLPELDAAGTDLRRLILAIVRSDAFLTRKAVAPEVCR